MLTLRFFGKLYPDLWRKVFVRVVRKTIFASRGTSCGKKIFSKRKLWRETLVKNEKKAIYFPKDLFEENCSFSKKLIFCLPSGFEPNVRELLVKKLLQC